MESALAEVSRADGGERVETYGARAMGVGVQRRRMSSSELEGTVEDEVKVTILNLVLQLMMEFVIISGLAAQAMTPTPGSGEIASGELAEASGMTGTAAGGGR